jgi:hypothetical protein
MKFKLKLIPVLLIGIALVYTACKKSDGGASQTLDSKTVSSQIALNLAATLYNGYGAFSITDGLNAPSNLGVDRNKIRLNMTKGRLSVNSLGDDITCGLVVDTTLNFSSNTNGVQVSVAGSIKFTFLCTNNTPSGFSMLNDLTVTESDSQTSGTVKLNENLTLQSVNPQDDNSKITMGGTLALSDNILNKSSKKTYSDSYNYTLTSLLIDPNTDGDIISGSATFATKGNNASGSWNYSGTITFLGNHKVKITINGTAYNVDLNTGAVS